MLQKIHDKITGWIAAIVIAPIFLAFIFWGINVGFGSVSYAAKVSTGDWPWWKPSPKVSSEEVRRAYQNQMAQYQQQLRKDVPPEMRAMVQENVLEAFIRNEILTQHSTNLGYRVSDAQVMKAYEEVPQFQVDGKFSAEAAKRLLETQGFSPAQFEAEQRRTLQISQLQNGLVLSSFVTPAELARARALQREQREASWMLIPAASFLAQSEPDDAAISAYYDKNKASFMTPDTVALKYLELKVDDIAAQVKVTDDALAAYYDSVKERYVEAEKRRGRHILIQVASDADDAAARKKAEEALAKVNAGGDFAKLAKEYSQDAGSAAQGGDLGWAERSYFVGPFADALFSMKPGEVRGPVRTQFGYHIIKLDEVKPGKQKTLQEARAEVEAEYRRQEAEKQFGERQEQLADKAFEHLDDLDAVAKEVSLPVHEIAEFTRDNGGAPFGKRDELISAVFENNDVLNGQNSRPVELAPGDVVVLHVTTRHEPQQKPLAEVRAQIVDTLRGQLASTAAHKTATELAEKLRSGGTTWSQAAAEHKFEVDGPKYVGRTESAMPTELRTALFAAPRPESGARYQAVPMGNGDAALLAFSGTRQDTSPEPAEDQQNRERELNIRIGTGEVMSYTRALRASANVTKNSKVFE
ncbi:MAG TPA: peptidyl-prolyl cis-trans isomerase [Steroidobacteraceae bacterium]|jgi:peptidyl-prolyl cis-trans isomerase D|nr:peptidyl-prolyl cis-trans isomerase [Steroidobacteraceae bacterium]